MSAHQHPYSAFFTAPPPFCGGCFRAPGDPKGGGFCGAFMSAHQHPNLAFLLAPPPLFWAGGSNTLTLFHPPLAYTSSANTWALITGFSTPVLMESGTLSAPGNHQGYCFLFFLFYLNKNHSTHSLKHQLFTRCSNKNYSTHSLKHQLFTRCSNKNHSTHRLKHQLFTRTTAAITVLLNFLTYVV